MPRELTELEINEVSLVDAPANRHAKVLLFKRDREGTEMERLAELIVKTEPQTFADLLAVAEGEELIAELGETLFRHISLLQASVASILESGASNKVEMTGTSIAQFEEAIDADLPEPENLAKALAGEPAAIAKAIRLPTAAELNRVDPFGALNAEIDAAAEKLAARFPDRFTSKSSARGEILRANPDAAAELEALQLERIAALTNRPNEESTMVKFDDLNAAHNAGLANIYKSRDTLDAEFEALVEEDRRPDESFHKAYNRIINTDVGRQYYAKHRAFRSQAAAVTKIRDDTLRYGLVAAENEPVEKTGETRAQLEMSFDAFVAEHQRGDETYHHAYTRLIDTPSGRDFYGRRAVA